MDRRMDRRKKMKKELRVHETQTRATVVLVVRNQKILLSSQDLAAHKIGGCWGVGDES